MCAVVDSDYDGPHLQGPITLDFVVQMIEHFKKQKRLHKKYAQPFKQRTCVAMYCSVLTALCLRSTRGLVFVGAQVRAEAAVGDEEDF